MENILLAQVLGALLGFLGVLFGAFGAHYLKGKLADTQLQAFETGVRYQLVHAVLLLVLSFNLELYFSVGRLYRPRFLIGDFLVFL